MTTYKERFQQLAKELESLAAGLNTQSAPCACCSALRYEAYEEELTARKLLGYADSFAKLAEATTGRGEAQKPAAFLLRDIPEPMTRAKAAESLPSWEVLEARLNGLAVQAMAPGSRDDGYRAVARDVTALINLGKQTEPGAPRVLAMLNPWLRAQGITPTNARDKLADSGKS